MSYEQFESDLTDDKSLMDTYGITESEKKIMADVVFSSAE